MKKTLAVLFFNLLLAVVVSAQTNQSSICPSLDVSGGWIVKRGELQTFTANLGNYDLSKLSFVWTVSSGEILEGQGTSTIKVLQKDFGLNLTATVSIKGLPENCTAEASETGSTICLPSARLLDEFSISELRIDKARLDYLVTELENNPNAQGFIVEYFKPEMPKNTINRKIQKITDYLVNQKRLDKSRFTISTSEYEQNWTKVWLVPPGAESPEP